MALCKFLRTFISVLCFYAASNPKSSDLRLYQMLRSGIPITDFHILRDRLVCFDLKNVRGLKIQFIYSSTCLWRANDCNALHTKVVSSALTSFCERSWRSANTPTGKWEKLKLFLINHHHLPSSFPLTQRVSVVSLRYWCDQSGAGLSSHPRVQHWHHCHSPAGSSGQSWEQACSSHSSEPVFSFFFFWPIWQPF